MALGYFPTSEEDKPRLTLLQVGLLLYYQQNPDTYHDPFGREVSVERELANKKDLQLAHLQLMDWTMISISDSTSEVEHANGLERFVVSDRGREHVKRILDMKLPVGRVVWTLPAEGE